MRDASSGWLPRFPVQGYFSVQYWQNFVESGLDQDEFLESAKDAYYMGEAPAPVHCQVPVFDPFNIAIKTIIP